MPQDIEKYRVEEGGARDDSSAELDSIEIEKQSLKARKKFVTNFDMIRNLIDLLIE